MSGTRLEVEKRWYGWRWLLLSGTASDESVEWRYSLTWDRMIGRIDRLRRPSPTRQYTLEASQIQNEIARVRFKRIAESRP